MNTMCGQNAAFPDVLAGDSVLSVQNWICNTQVNYFQLQLFMTKLFSASFALSLRGVWFLCQCNVRYFITRIVRLLLFCTMINKCTIISQIITLVHVSTLL
jgi:hypothetical protein